VRAAKDLLGASVQLFNVHLDISLRGARTQEIRGAEGSVRWSFVSE
jgi:hypothetical protein